MIDKRQRCATIKANSTPKSGALDNTGCIRVIVDTEAPNNLYRLDTRDKRHLSVGPIYLCTKTRILDSRSVRRGGKEMIFLNRNKAYVNIALLPTKVTNFLVEARERTTEAASRDHWHVGVCLQQ